MARRGCNGAQYTINKSKGSLCVGATLESIFSVKSMYSALLTSEAAPHNTFIWKLKLPLKIKVFLWYLYKRVILTKDNLVRRQWQGDTKCCFYSSASVYNIYSLTIILLNSCGELFMFPLIYYLQLVFIICLQAG